MAQVMFDRAIRYQNGIYTVSQTWNENEPVISINPPNADLESLIRSKLNPENQLVLQHVNGAFEIVE